MIWTCNASVVKNLRANAVVLVWCKRSTLASTETISKKSGRSREVRVCKELDYDGGERLKTFITAQNSLERRMVVIYCSGICIKCN